MMIDTLADRYKLLPSEVISRATTFDIMVCDTAVSYRAALERKASGQPEEHTDAELLAMLERTRGKN